MSWFRRHRSATAYLLLAPGILYLIVFYLYPTVQMFLVSLWTGNVQDGYALTFNFGIYPEALAQYNEHFIRSLIYGGAATVLTFLIGFPLAYFIAFQGGRYKSLLLFLVIAPFFTSFLLRTISWKIIFSDNGILFGPIKDAGLLPPEFRVLATPVAVVAGNGEVDVCVLARLTAEQGIDTPAALDRRSDACCVQDAENVEHVSGAHRRRRLFLQDRHQRRSYGTFTDRARRRPPRSTMPAPYPTRSEEGRPRARPAVKLLVGAGTEPRIRAADRAGSPERHRRGSRSGRASRRGESACPPQPSTDPSLPARPHRHGQGRGQAGWLVARAPRPPGRGCPRRPGARSRRLR